MMEREDRNSAQQAMNSALRPPTVPNTPVVTAIMPVYNGREMIKKSLPPLLAMRQKGEVLEVIVVDDSSTDGSAEVAVELGALVLHSGGRVGPGAARNQAALKAKGSLLWFVDADVVVHDDAARQVQAAFENPDVVAVFGSYDDHPPAANFFSQYKNLVHHFYHHKARRDASTFWAGCGAVRKDAFIKVGGFDVKRYTRPSIEDIELGYRLREAGGRIMLWPSLQGTHLKIWRFANLIHTELFCRAIPWSRLMLTRSGMVNDLNVSLNERLRAVVAGIFLVSVAATLHPAVPWWAALAAFCIVVIANSDLLRLFQRRRGLLFALGGLLFHQIYYLYSTSAFAWCWLEHRIFQSNR